MRAATVLSCEENRLLLLRPSKVIHFSGATPSADVGSERPAVSFSRLAAPQDLFPALPGFVWPALQAVLYDDEYYGQKRKEGEPDDITWRWLVVREMLEYCPDQVDQKVCFNAYTECTGFVVRLRIATRLATCRACDAGCWYARLFVWLLFLRDSPTAAHPAAAAAAASGLPPASAPAARAASHLLCRLGEAGNSPGDPGVRRRSKRGAPRRGVQRATQAEGTA